MKKVILVKTVLFICFIFAFTANAKDCKNGYIWKPNSGIGCVQANCKEIPDAHYGYVGDCVCGSSGSINENPKDPNQECRYDQDYESCPGCVYACIGIDDECPNEKKEVKNQEEQQIEINKNTNNPTPSSSTKNPENSNVPTNKSANSNPPLLTTASITSKRTCQKECEKLKMGGQYDEVLEVLN